MMADSQQRFATITGVLSDYIPITNISGDGQVFTSHFLQVRLETIDIESTEWEWPHFHFVYIVLDDLLRDTPALGDHIQADGALNLTHFALSGNGKQTASTVKTLYERIALYANNWAEVNLVNQRRREFDTLTQQFAASPWRFDEWLNAQNALLPQSDALATLQALLTETAKLRADALSQSAPVAALMQNLTAIKLTHQPGFDHQPITRQLIQLDDQARLMHLHHGLLEQSAALARNQARSQDL
ncbi:hypothetical protein FD01_GL002034 [Lacticaseibacillus manihotivorans DSM 13343 = JCM 12514]|uniref:Uncharacterized protein n=3 Tax=Lacticaseibacillus manihotivorans TaxID=88233 RepID=A0A0R1QBG5_9LACO|nr:hypothetical protein [Lacticaseibacillus manihotivorans]KRL42032.1 hypothetical protein FD01_GL002034 [Lacticaseibacillus manihotivorans DSM 13343 = JCM 12514]QFQ92704.1 hypothetical protein LM010_15475 [Lacticaseibacillus manihotivorans]